MKSQRNYGIDLLRILCMIMVCMLHVLGFGDILSSSTPLSSQYEVAWLLDTACFCAVNCYALISGYVGFNSRFKLSNLLTLWIQVTFYNFGIYVLGFLLKLEPLSISTLVRALFPVTSVSYWYFTAYFCAFFLFPAINFLVEHMPQTKMRLTVAACVILFSLIPTLRNGYLFGLENGYNAIWIIVLYLFGYYIRKYNSFSTWSVWRSFGIYAASVLVAWIWRWGMDILGSDRADMFCKYISVTILICAVALLAAFSKMEFSATWKKIIAFVSPLSFGVYIIHLHPIFLGHVIGGRYAAIAALPAPLLFVAVILASVGLFIFCAGIDFLRLQMFKLLRVRDVTAYFSNRIMDVAYKFAERTEKSAK